MMMSSNRNESSCVEKFTHNLLLSFGPFFKICAYLMQLATARQSLLPAATAVKFPVLPVRTANGEQFTLPVEQNIHDEMAETCASAPVTLVCIAFRGHGQVI